MYIYIMYVMYIIYICMYLAPQYTYTSNIFYLPPHKHHNHHPQVRGHGGMRTSFRERKRRIGDSDRG
jgi:hypothetical protein